MRRLGGRATWTGAAAVILVVVVSLPFLAWQGDGEGVVSGIELPMLSAADLRSLELGTSRDEVEHRVGAGESALEFGFYPGGTGAAVEPMDATCVYYLAAGAARGPVQLCYRDDQLVSKRVYR
jgi:hypothetical protein